LSEADEVTPLGERIFEYTRDISAGHAVRRRRDLMATIIDELCMTRAKPHILSVAAGTCARRRYAVPSRRQDGRFVAMDRTI
jgi:hypothetical protein